ncbi:MAG: helicase-related protein [Pseudomonadota bacterium]
MSVPPAASRPTSPTTASARPIAAPSRNVTAVLGPTNTGKTHLALERMVGHETGLIGLPLRLLAREVYDRVVAKVGADQVALITGEEKIRPEGARFSVCTVEAMPHEPDVAFLAIDEVQLCADPERGHTFTDRLLHARGHAETLFLGAQTAAAAISELVPGANFISRPRLSSLSYAGQKKITRLPRRSAVVAFSANEVYAIAELMRRQHGGAAVVMGALSPRTRNAQVALYQSGDVDYLVATDAIGMGLNLDVDHVAFSALRKFDGERHRDLTPGELGQIAGRAGRHMNDGTFGVSGDARPFDAEMVERLENHEFDPLKTLQWRSRAIAFDSLDALRDSLRQMPNHPRLARARMADDVSALEALARDPEIADKATKPDTVRLLWDVCQVPDYRKISHQAHGELVSKLFHSLTEGARKIDEDWFARQVDQSAKTDGDIDTLATRLAHIRTWTFVSNRADWLKDPAHWQARTRAIEDSLSDALHEQLTQRFIDKKTSALMKGMRESEGLSASLDEAGGLHVENHYVGKLDGFMFTHDPGADAAGIHGKAARHAAAQALAPELAMRVRRVVAAKDDAFKLAHDGHVMWRDQRIARLQAGDDQLKPTIALLVDEHMSNAEREKVQARLDTWCADLIKERLRPLVELSQADDITGLGRGIAFQLKEAFGCLRRDTVTKDIKTLEQTERAQLRRHGVRFGAFNIFFPVLLKPAQVDLLMVLWALKHGGEHGLSLDAMPTPPRPGLTSFPIDPAVPEPFYRVAGYHVCGPRAVRVDILERLADLIRPLLAWRAKGEQAATAKPPAGSTGEGGFVVVPDMMSILGCSSEELGGVLKALGFRSETRARPKTMPAAEPAKPAAAGPSATQAKNAGAAGTDAAQTTADAGAQAAKAAGTSPAAGASDAATPASAQPLDKVTEAASAPAASGESDKSEAPSVTVEPEGTPSHLAEGAQTTSEPAPEVPQVRAATPIEAPAGAAPGAATEAATPSEPPSQSATGDAASALEAPAAHGAEGGTESGTKGSASVGASEPAEAAAPSPTAEGQADATAGATQDAAAPDMIEIWRPARRRYGNEQRGRRHGGRGHAHADAAGASDAGGRAGEGQRRGPGRQRPSGQGSQGSGSDGARGPGGRGGPGNREGGQRAAGGAQGRGPGGGKGGQKSRRPKHGQDRRDRTPVHAVAAPKKKAADADSPFAALGALKSELAKRSKEPSS